MTREQQIASAREFAERNPEWLVIRRYSGTSPVSVEHGIYGGSIVVTEGGRWGFENHHLRGQTHDSPASAARALGFDVKE